MKISVSLRKLASGIALAMLVSSLSALPASAAPSTPTNVSVASTSEPNTALSSASARVEWAASTGAVGYSILATAGDQNVFGSTPVCQNGNCVAFLSGLTGGTSYGVRVSAVAADGSSAASAPVNHVAVSVPSSPAGLSATAGNGVVRLQWTEPGSLGGLALSGYVLIDQENRETSLASGVVSITVSSLVNGTSYTFRLLAVNQNGRSAESRFSATTPVGPPASPARPSVSTTSNTLTATWVAPVDGGSPITGYRAVLFRGGTQETEQNLGAGVLTATFNNLSAANYTVRVQGINAIGASDLSIESLTTAVGQVQQPQTISFDQIQNQTPPGAINLLATASSGLTVAFTATGVCSVEVGATILSFQSVGTCTVVASQAGNSGFQAATPVTRSFQVSNTVVQPDTPSLGGGGGGGGRAPAQSSGGGGSGTADIFISESPTVSYRIGGEVLLTISGSALSTVYRVTLGGVTASFVARTDNTLNLKFIAPPTGSNQLIIFFGDRARSLTVEVVESAGTVATPTSSPIITTPTPSESSQPTVAVPRPKAPSASVGSFKGLLAIYLSQLEGQRVSLRIAGKWQTVRSVPSNFFRLTRKVGSGFRVNVQVFVAGKALKTITVRTK